MQHTDRERLATLEQAVDDFDRRWDRVEKRLNHIDQGQQAMQLELAQTKGMVRAVLWMLGLLASVGGTVAGIGASAGWF